MKRIAALLLFFSIGLAFVGCMPESLYALTNEPMDASVFNVLSDDERARFEAFCDNLPVSMTVRYDQMYADATVTDVELMCRMYDAITKIRVVAKTEMSKTDGYHRVVFEGDDGKEFSLSFEHDLLSEADSRYELENAGEFWTLFKEIAEEYGGN